MSDQGFDVPANNRFAHNRPLGCRTFSSCRNAFENVGRSYGHTLVAGNKVVDGLKAAVELAKSNKKKSGGG